MAKETDIKKIELRVSVNCCDGCKRKVKKALQGVEGVLKTEIDTSQPRVTAIGNVDPKILIKRLQKAGKQAELWSNRNQSPGKENKEVDVPMTKGKTKHECDKPKSSDSCCNTVDKNKESKNGEDRIGDIATKKEEKLKESEVIKNENPVPPQPEMNCKHSVPPQTETNYNMSVPEAGNIRAQTQYCYMVEPYAITVPYYAIPSCPTHPLPPTFYGQPHCCHERPPYQTPVTRVGDYFSDENTLGCSVM